MGEVLKARDPQLNRFIAIKVLPDVAAADPERRQRFEREAKAIAALNHPHIVTIHSVEEADGLVFLTMELVEGRSLAEVLSTGGLSLDRLLKIAIPVADAIAAAHQKRIMHRDLKPANIMVGEGEHEGRIKVLDFGLVKLSEWGEAPTDDTTLPGASITGEGRILGTVAYMSPEQAEGRIVDARSDVFSLGIVLYEMATGQRPFTGNTSISLISSILKDTPKSVTEVNPILPRDLGRIVRRALAKDLDRRYQTAKDLRNDLEELKVSLESGELQPRAAGSGALPRDGGMAPRARRTIVATLAIAAIVLALGSGLYWTTQRRPQSAVPSSTGPSIQDLQLVQLTTSGNAQRPVISPDGKYVAYVQQSGAAGATGSSVWIRQVATSSDVQIVPPEPGVVLQGLTVTPDGNFVDYIRRDRGNSELWRVSFLGGTPKKLLVDVRTPIGWSSDGRLAFVREDLQRGKSELAAGGHLSCDISNGDRRWSDDIIHLDRSRAPWPLENH